MTYRVFVSSTRDDLVSYREKVQEAIRKLGVVDVAMEHFGARTEQPVAECLRLVREESDLFVGIYAHRYGYVPDGEETSITELEYVAAVAAGLPCFIFLVDSDVPWLPAHIDADEKARKLELFKKLLLGKHICVKFSNLDELATNVATSLARHVGRQQLPSVGPGIPVPDIGIHSMLQGILQEHPARQLLETPSEWSRQRTAIYEYNRNIFLTHVVQPSTRQGQEFDVYIYLIRHEAKGYRADDFSDVLFAEFFLGWHWENKIFPAVVQNGFIGISTAAYGTVLCTCRVTFRDGKQVHLDRYIDFEAARAGSSAR